MQIVKNHPVYYHARTLGCYCAHNSSDLLCFEPLLVQPLSLLVLPFVSVSPTLCHCWSHPLSLLVPPFVRVSPTPYHC